MFTIASQGMQICSLSAGMLAFIFEITAHSNDLQYNGRTKLSHLHDETEDAGLLLNGDSIRKNYFSTTWRNLWYEPMAISFIVLSLGMYSGYVYLAYRSRIVAESLFLTAIVNGVQIYLLTFSAMLILKSYIIYDNAYFDSFVKGVKIHYFGLHHDAYMRLYCYDGFFRQDLRSGHHFDEKHFEKAVLSTSVYRSKNHTCQQACLKLLSVFLLLVSSIFCSFAQWLVCCKEISPEYDFTTLPPKMNQVSPEVTFRRGEASYNRKELDITQKIKSKQGETDIEYQEDDENIEFSLSSDEDIMEFSTTKKNSKT